MKEVKIENLNQKIVDENKGKDIVLGDGKVDSELMLIGEAPGANEVKKKKPFVGQAGKYLEEFISVLDTKREAIYITNTVKFRPTKISNKTNKQINRPPTKEEVSEFKAYLYDEIGIINPKILIPLGNVPLKAILQKEDIKIGDVHGQLLKTKINNKTYQVFPLYHPAAVIYRRELKEVYYQDLSKLKEILNKG